MVHPTEFFLLASLLLITTATRVGHLSRDVLPENYNLEIITYLDDDKNIKFIFEGKVSITIQCMKSTDKIFLNVKDLNVHQAVTLNKIGGDRYSVYVEEWRIFTKNETMSIRFNKPLKVGSIYNLTIRFTGNITGASLTGYYRNYITDAITNKKKRFASTHFEPTYARKAFPCFDEPNFKATFEISLGRLEKYTSLSNMPLKKTEPMKEREGWFWDRYQKSVRMSTYLVAYVVFDYKPRVVPTAPTNNVTFRIWCSEDEKNNTDLAADVGPKALEFFEQYLSVKYVLPKQDMVAVRLGDGAMENWGLITFRKSLLLHEPDPYLYSHRQKVANVISHELSHQWFGNLVTMKWWSDIWLHEGFATFMAAFAVHRLYPEWNSLNEERVNDMLKVFSSDSFTWSRPISKEAGTPSEIWALFDGISYQKGSCLVNMMVHFLGEETFRKGITKYLNENKYKNVEQDDLFKSLTIEGHNSGTLAKNMNVKTIMDTWTLQGGYPLVTVIRNYEAKSVNITQEQFYINVHDPPSDRCWWIPLTYTNQREKDFGNTSPKEWLTCSPSPKIINDIANEKEWTIFNIRMTGLYVVNYDDRNWEMIMSTLNSESYRDIAVLNRFQLVEDSAKLAALDKLSYKVFFGILQYLDKETDYVPWMAVEHNVLHLLNSLRNTSALGTYRDYMKRLLNPIAKKLKELKGEPETPEGLNNLKLRDIVLGLADYFNGDSNSKDIREMFRNYVKSLKVKSPRLRTDYNLMLFNATINNEMGYQLAQLFFKNKLQDVFESVKSDDKKLSSLLIIISEYVTTTEEYNQFKQFINKHNKTFSKLRNDVDLALDKAKFHIQWRKLHLHRIEQFLKL